MSRTHRTITNQIIDVKEIVATPSKKNEKESKNLKVIAFKITKDYKNFIDSVTKVRKTYASLSELVRIAIMDLIDYCIRLQNNEMTDFELSDMINKVEDEYEDMHKVSACSKFPEQLLKVTDKIWKDLKRYFKNRTEFIRVALFMLREKENNIYDYWLKSNGRDSNK